ncbi:MAG: hypothetical protein WCK77_25720, partial [Verrucomicrobiota bacterium]
MEPKELSPEVAGKILDADFQNVVRKVAAGKPLTVAERSRIEARAAGSQETLAYAKTSELSVRPQKSHWVEQAQFPESAVPFSSLRIMGRKIILERKMN